MMSKLLSSVPTSLYNVWHKLVRYQHHLRFLSRCLAKKIIPKGLNLKFNLELAKDNGDLNDFCKQQLFTTSLNILTRITEAAKEKMKNVRKQLEEERRKLFDGNDQETATRIWRRVKRHMSSVYISLKKKERKKLASAIRLSTASKDTQEKSTQPSRRPKNRRFCKNLRNTRPSQANGVTVQENSQVAEHTTSQDNQDTHPINLTDQELTDAQVNLLAKGPSFCPIPKDINWLKVQEDLDAFERRVRISAFFANRSESRERNVDPTTIPEAVKKSTWDPPKAPPEVELFLANVRKDVLDPNNVRKPFDNLSKEEREALKQIRNDENLVIRIQDKGSRFVILDKSAYVEKITSQLDNDLHYAKSDVDPTSNHFDKVKKWSQKWLSEKQISQDVADWVTDTTPKPGVAFGNIKTHKVGNPLRLITSCCGTAIERLSAFTESFLKPLSNKLPSFLKDTTDLINKINELNIKGPLPQGTLLVSWDVVGMFPNIDNNLGLSAVREALDSRPVQIPSSNCILEAVKICLESNNSEFNGGHYIQCHGTAMGPKNACSYADLAMGKIDELATGGPVKPNLWWRYRDDVVEVWTHGLEKLHEFTDYINSLYPTIKFELVYSDRTLNVLDLTLTFKDGFISTDIYSKPTDSHLYLPYNSSHPAHCKRAVPYGVALRINRNCSSVEQRDARAREYQTYLERQGYPKSLIKGKFNKAFSVNRGDLLKPSAKEGKKIIPLVLDYNPRLPDISAIINKHCNLIYNAPLLQQTFPPKSLVPSFRRTKNLKELIAPSRFRPTGNALEQGKCFRCAKKCDLCKHLTETDKFQSFATGRTYYIKESVSCSSQNVIYLIACNRCRLQYVGSSKDFKRRFANHKSHMKHNKNTCEVAKHFNSAPHSLDEFEFVIIEQIRNQGNLERALLNREAYWTSQLRCLFPYGLNKRKEYKSNKRVKFNK